MSCTVGAIATDMVLLPQVKAISRNQVRQPVEFLKLPLTRAALIVTLIMFVGQFTASSYITPFLLYRGTSTLPRSRACSSRTARRESSAPIGGVLIARNRIVTWVAAALGTGAALTALAAASARSTWRSASCWSCGFIWGAVPLSSQVRLLSSAGEHQEPASSVGVWTMRIAIAGGAALGGLLVDSTGFTTVFAVAGSLAVAAAVLATAIGRDRPSSLESVPRF